MATAEDSLVREIELLRRNNEDAIERVEKDHAEWVVRDDNAHKELRRDVDENTKSINNVNVTLAGVSANLGHILGHIQGQQAEKRRFGWTLLGILITAVVTLLVAALK